MKKRVVIIKQGRRGMVPPGYYDDFIKTLTKTIERVEEEGSGTGEMEKVAEVKVKPTLREAQGRLRAGAIDILIFISLSMRKKAEEIKNKYRGLKVIVLTASLPEEVILLDKTWLATTESVQRIILH